PWCPGDRGVLRSAAWAGGPAGGAAPPGRWAARGAGAGMDSLRGIHVTILRPADGSGVRVLPLCRHADNPLAPSWRVARGQGNHTRAVDRHSLIAGVPVPARGPLAKGVVTMDEAGQAPGPVRVCHITTGLSMGGAEAMLLKLLEGLGPSARGATVVSMMDRGALGGRIEALGIQV